MPPVIDKTKCANCGTCYENCPLDVFHWSKDGRETEVKYPEECWHCNACKLDCPNGAIQLRLPLPAMLLYTASPHRN
jgi:adenylylsulfate reductase subunit B